MSKIRKSALKGLLGISQFFGKSSKIKVALFNAVRLNKKDVSFILNDYDFRFLAYCISRRSHSKSQILQDLWVSFELDDKRNGYFVEFGATNGVKNSNTWFLEKERGWTGIVAEPNPLWHEALALNRQCAIEQKCVSSKTGEFVDFLTTNESDPELSGIAAFSEGDHFAGVRRKGNIIKVETISLDDLFDKHSAPPVIDFISIDTEGSELDILKNYSFSRRFLLMSVETNLANATEIRDLLHGKGYIKVFSEYSQWDGWYVDCQMRTSTHDTIYAPES